MTNGPRRRPVLPSQVTRREQPGDGREPSFTNYELRLDAGDHPETGAPMTKDGVEMAVEHGKSWTDYSYRSPSGLPNFGASGEDLHTDAPGGQMKLFGTNHREGESKVGYLRSTKNLAARANVGAMLALAQQDLDRTHPGRTLGADDDRSKFSENLTDRLGANLGMQFSERTHENHISWLSDGGEWYNTPRGDKADDEEFVSGGEMKAATKTARSWLRGPKHGPEKPRDPDPQLPGMEGM